MSWIANSPYGPLPAVLWACAVCDAHGNARDFADADRLRARAIRHLEETGHQVGFSRGTREIIEPMAMTAAGTG